MAKWVGTWALIVVLSLVMAKLFINAWDAEWTARMANLAKHQAWVAEQQRPYQFDFAGGRTKSTGHGYYDRRKERGRK
jgi:hypothetical protein